MATNGRRKATLLRNTSARLDHIGTDQMQFGWYRVEITTIVTRVVCTNRYKEKQVEKNGVDCPPQVCNDPKKITADDDEWKDRSVRYLRARTNRTGLTDCLARQTSMISGLSYVRCVALTGLLSFLHSLSYI